MHYLMQFQFKIVQFEVGGGFTYNWLFQQQQVAQRENLKLRWTSVTWSDMYLLGLPGGSNFESTYYKGEKKTSDTTQISRYYFGLRLMSRYIVQVLSTTLKEMAMMCWIWSFLWWRNWRQEGRPKGILSGRTLYVIRVFSYQSPWNNYIQSHWYST